MLHSHHSHCLTNSLKGSLTLQQGQRLTKAPRSPIFVRVQESKREKNVPPHCSCFPAGFRILEWAKIKRGIRAHESAHCLPVSLSVTLCHLLMFHSTYMKAAIGSKFLLHPQMEWGLIEKPEIEEGKRAESLPKRESNCLPSRTTVVLCHELFAYFLFRRTSETCSPNQKRILLVPRVFIFPCGLEWV